jgi:tetratricopeptide (TPR) repeat protein
MNDKLNQTGIKDTTIGDNAQISIEQKIILPSVPKQVTENPHNLPNSGVAQFVGRDDVLTQLDQQLQQNDRVAISTLTGMGGIGKSELALQYGWQEWPKQTYRGGICWLNVADSDPGLSILSFAQIHLGLTLPEEGELVERVRFIWQGWLKNKKDQTLIIFDDVRDYQQIKDYLPPQANQRFKVIITTRNQQIASNFSLIDVKVLSPEKALELLAVFLSEAVANDRQTAQELCAWLGYLPLGIELVGHYGKYMKSSLAEILKQLKAQRLDDESLQVPHNAFMTAQRGVAAAFELSWKELSASSQLAGQLISLFAESAINQDLITAFFEVTTFRKQTFREKHFPTFSKLFSKSENVIVILSKSDLRHLVNLNLLKDLGESNYELHTLIRHYLRAKLEASAVKETAKKAYGAVMVKVAKTIDYTLTLEDVARIDPFIDHLKIATEELNQWLDDEDLILPFTGLARFYNAQGLYNKAIPYSEQCLKVTEPRLGENHPKVATSLNNLAGLYRTQGKYVEAEPLYTRSLSIYEKVYGENHPNVAQSLNNLAALYESQGKYTEAEPLYTRSLSIRESQVGENHLDVAQSLNNLAALYESQGKYAEAETLCTRSLSIMESQLEKNHPNVATSLNNLAGLYDSQGKYEEAEPLYIRALSMRESQLGENHPDVAASLNNLALLYKAQGKYEEIEPLLKRSLSILESQLGENHPDVAQSLNNLAGLYDSQGKYAEAEPLFMRSLSIREKQLGENHPDVASSLYNLALLYNAQGNYAEAKTLSQRALTIFQQKLGDQHPDTQDSLFSTKMFNVQVLLDCDTQTVLGHLKALAQQANLPYPDTETMLILLEEIATNPQLLQSLRQAL